MKNPSTNPESTILGRLYDVVRERQHTPRPDSYVASLLQKGPEAIREKIAEETDELLEASRSSLKHAIIHETADLWFHTIVLLGHHEVTPAAVYRELARRWGRSGLKKDTDAPKGCHGN